MAAQRPLVLIGGSAVMLPAADTLVTNKDVLLAELASTFTIAGTTLADVTGFSFALKASSTYLYVFDLLITQATAVSIVGLGVNYTGTLVRLATVAEIANAATAATFRAATANNAALLDNAARAIGGPFPARVAGTIVTTSAGTLTLRAQRSAATTTILLGSSGQALQV